MGNRVHRLQISNPTSPATPSASVGDDIASSFQVETLEGDPVGEDPIPGCLGYDESPWRDHTRELWALEGDQ